MYGGTEARYPQRMMDRSDYITVFRSAEMSAAEEARTVRDMLVEAGLSPEVCGDDTPGVVEGTYEVRVPATESMSAEGLIASRALPDTEVDTSRELDMVPIFSSQSATSEVEAVGIKAVLEAGGIPALIVDASALPNLPHEVRVPRERLEDAQRLLAEARAAGPQAAEEASQAERT